jgi:putative ABC transport system permease protein
MLWESFKLALRSVRRNVLRSFLTLLGIVIGVAAVIALMTIGSGANQKISADIAKLGSNMLIVRPGAQGPGPPGGSDARSFNERDIEALRAGISDVRGIAPSASKQASVVFEAMRRFLWCRIGLLFQELHLLTVTCGRRAMCVLLAPQ